MLALVMLCILCGYNAFENDVKIEECLLQEGDRVRFAMKTYIYHE